MSSKQSSPKTTPSPGSLTNPPNLVGKRFSPDEFNGRFLINASIQKIVNLPAILAAENFTESKDKLEFKLTLTVNTSGEGIASSICKASPVVATFTPEMVRKARGSGQFEVSFNVPSPSTPKDSSSSSSSSPNSATSTWIIQAEGRNQLVGKCSMKLQLQEFINGSPYRVLFDQTTQIILQKVLDRKALVFLYGSPVGRIGVTLCVSSDDQIGYKKRMDRFLAQFSASPDPNIASSIMAKCDEITTFAYLWKRYGIVDYTARLRRFLSLYSKHLVGQEENLLNKYKMHEEEMFMNLVLDNGPEELDIDAKKRLEAFKSRYFLTSLDVEREASRGFADFLGYIDMLVEQNGAEPDPRTYLFPEPNYKPPPGVVVEQSSSSSLSPQQKSASAPPIGASSPQQNSNTSNSDKQQQQRAKDLQNQMPNAVRVPVSPVKKDNSNFPSTGGPRENRTLSAPPASSSSALSPSSSPISKAQQAASAAQRGSSQQPQQQQGMFNTTNHHQGTTGASSSSSPSAQNTNTNNDLWSSFINSLTSRRVSSSDIFFLSDDAFLSLMSQVNVAPNNRHLIVSEWKRRAAENLQLTHFAPSDPSFEAVRNEVLNLTGMQQINLSVLGVVGLRNSEHEATHATRLTLMNSESHKKIERCVYPGEYNTLLKCAERGITAIMSASDSGLCFPRRPFAEYEKPSAISVMICDIISGFQTNASTVKEAANARSDTVAVSGDGNPGESGLFVRDVRHVLPRYIVHCHVDPTLIPCPLHPTKQVEYYVVDQQVFACSNCVVLGPHVGKPIVTLDEALQWSRTQLNEILRDAEAVNSAASEVDRDMQEQLDSITGENARRRKEELIESIRREAELRAQDAAKQLEAEMAMQADVLKAQLHRIAPLKSTLNQTSRTLQNTVRQSNVARALDVLQQVSQNYDGTDGRNRVAEIKNTLSMMPQLSHNGSRAPWVYASHGGISFNNNTNNNQNQTQNPNQTSASVSMSQQQQQHGGFGRFMDAANVVASNRSSQQRQSSVQNNNNNSELFNKFVNASSASQSQQHSRRNSIPNMNNNNMNQQNQPSSAAASPGGQSTASTNMNLNMNMNPSSTSSTNLNSQQQQGRELLQDGWKAFRRGDTSTARSLWTTASERYPNTSVGARALAYCAEAIDKDAVKAAEYYERAMQCDPTDCMTLFNYGVLLEATGHTMRALQLFESAQRLGDVASGKRARAIRQQQLASNDR